MPTYVYEFEDGRQIEVKQSMRDEPLREAVHPIENKLLPVTKRIANVHLDFKGPGWTPKKLEGS